MPYQVLKYPDPALRQIAEPVARIDSGVRALATEMASLMYEHHGVGLAAPQVGEARRLIVVDCDYGDGAQNLRILINPVIREKKGATTYEEGCLSIPGFYMKVARAAEVRVEATDLAGGPVKITADGLLAIVLQHEIDHLNGVLIFDYLPERERAEVIQKVLDGHYEKELTKAKK